MMAPAPRSRTRSGALPPVAAAQTRGKRRTPPTSRRPTRKANKALSAERAEEEKNFSEACAESVISQYTRNTDALRVACARHSLRQADSKPEREHGECFWDSVAWLDAGSPPQDAWLGVRAERSTAFRRGVADTLVKLDHDYWVAPAFIPFHNLLEPNTTAQQLGAQVLSDAQTRASTPVLYAAAKFLQRELIS